MTTPTPADARREKIVEVLAAAKGPLSGSALGEACGVSRQVVVQDVALLRSRGVNVLSTSRGYVLMAASGQRRPTRLFKCRHTVEQTEEELNCIVDVGACVEDVFVNHRVYGKLTTQLGIACRRDVARFMADIRSGKSSPLMQITSGYHFHHVSAPSEQVLDEVGAELAMRGFLAEPTDYERDAFLDA